MDKQNFKEMLNYISHLINDFGDLDLEDFIKQANFMLKEDNLPPEFSREQLGTYLMVANHFLALKTNLLMNRGAFTLQ